MTSSPRHVSLIAYEWVMSHMNKSCHTDWESLSLGGSVLDDEQSMTCKAFHACIRWQLMLYGQVEHCNTLRHTATHCSTLQHNVTRCNTLQHTTTHCYTLQHIATAAHCNTLQHTATHYSALQRTAAHCNALQYTATPCSTLQHPATLAARDVRTGRISHNVKTWLIHMCDITHSYV